MIRGISCVCDQGSEAIFPVLSDAGEVIGTIDVESDRRNACCKDDSSCKQCAIALRRLWYTAITSSARGAPVPRTSDAENQPRGRCGASATPLSLIIRNRRPSRETSYVRTNGVRKPKKYGASNNLVGVPAANVGPVCHGTLINRAHRLVRKAPARCVPIEAVCAARGDRRLPSCTSGMAARRFHTDRTRSTDRPATGHREKVPRSTRHRASAQAALGGGRLPAARA